MELSLTSVSKTVGTKCVTSFSAYIPAGMLLPSGSTYLLFVILQ